MSGTYVEKLYFNFCRHFLDKVQTFTTLIEHFLRNADSITINLFTDNEEIINLPEHFKYSSAFDPDSNRLSRLASKMSLRTGTTAEPMHTPQILSENVFFKGLEQGDQIKPKQLQETINGLHRLILEWNQAIVFYALTGFNQKRVMRHQRKQVLHI